MPENNNAPQEEKLTSKQKKEALGNFEYANLIFNLSNSQESGLIPYATMGLAKNLFGIKDVEKQRMYAEPFSEKNGGSIQGLINSYVPQYMRALNQSDTSGLFSHYNISASNVYSNGSKGLDEDVLNIEYSKLEEKLMKAREVLKSKTDNFTDEQKKEAKKIEMKFGHAYDQIKRKQQEQMEDLTKPLREMKATDYYGATADGAEDAQAA